MKKLTFEDLKELAFGERFYVVSGGKVVSYYFVSKNPLIPCIIAIKSFDLNIPVSFPEYSLNDKTFLSGSYDTKEIGRIMIEQMEREIETIRQVYLTEW